MPLLRYSRGTPPPEDAAESNSTTPVQISPSQLPELLTGLKEEECANITAHILPHLRRLLCCPICYDILINDPVVVETCGHAFCYDCINTAIEEGFYKPLPDNGENNQNQAKDSEACGIDKEENKSECGGKGNERKRPRALGRVQRRERPRRRKLQFTCPVCFGPAFKWTLVRIPLIRDVVMEAMSHSVLANAIKNDPNTVEFDNAKTCSCLSPFGVNADETCPLNALTVELNSMAANAAHITDTSVTRCLSASAALISGSSPMASSSFVMGSQQQSMVIIPIPRLPSRTVENSHVSPTEHEEDSIINTVNDVAESHPINDTLCYNYNSGGSRRNRSSSSSVRTEDLQGVLNIEDIGREDEKNPRDTLNILVPLLQPDPQPAIEEESSELNALEEVNHLVLGEANEEGSRGLARVLRLSPTSSEEQEQLRKGNPGPQNPSADTKDNFTPIETSAVSAWRETTPPLSSVSSLRLVIDASVPQGTHFENILFSASQLFGAVVNADERVCDGKTRNEFILTQPLRTIVRNCHSMNTKENRKCPSTSPGYWIELHYPSVPTINTHCIAGFHLDRDGTIVSSVTPTIACAFVTRSDVVSWTWLADSVAARRLLPTVPYREKGALRAQYGPNDSRPGQWMTQGYGFLVLPDDQLRELLFDDNSVLGPIGQITGGFKNERWRSLVLLGGGVWLCPSDHCLGALVKRAMGTQEAKDNSTVWETVVNGMNATKEALWRAECCPDRAGDLSLHTIVILRASVPVANGSEVNECCMSRFVKAISEFFDVAEIGPQEPIDFSSRVQFGRKEDDDGDGPPLSPITPTQFTFPADVDEGDNGNIKVEVRSCRWLLKNIAENRQTAGVRRRYHSRDDLGSSAIFSGGAVFQQLLYDV